MINASNYAGNGNPSRPGPPTMALVRQRSGGRPAGSRVRDALVFVMGVDWLAYRLRRWGDRWFAMNDTEAYWRGWQITRTHAGLGRRYRDIRFDNRGETDRADPEEPAWSGGLGNHGPFG